MNRNHPKISVIVTTYNQENTIGRTIDSILAQDCDFDYEIIIGEDCSSDHTAEICRMYATRYPDKIRLLQNKKNKGLLDNYFDCILASSGEYIADCAGDDYWIDNQKLNKQCHILDSDNTIVLTHTGWNIHDVTTGNITPANQNESIYHQPIMEKGSLMLPALRRNDAPIVHLCTAMYRRDIFLKIYSEDPQLFRNKEFTCEDLQIIVAFSSEGKFAYLPDITLNYSVGAPSISSEENLLKTFDFCLGAIKLTKYIQQKYNIANKELEKYYQTDIHYIITCAFNAGDWQRCRTAKDLAKKYGLKLPLKSRILNCVSNIPFIRDIALKIKQTFD